MDKITRIGLTGGVGSGKSRVAELLRGAGVTVVNLDDVGRELTDKDPAVIAEIGRLCGPSVIDEKGELDRRKVRDVIFSDAKARAALEAFLHPHIKDAFDGKCAEAQRAGKKLVVCEAALLVESGIHKALDGLIVVIAPEEKRRDRVMARDRITAALAEKMIRAQMAEAEKRKPATVVIENHGSLAELAVRVAELLEAWRSQGIL